VPIKLIPFDTHLNHQFELQSEDELHVIVDSDFRENVRDEIEEDLK